MRKVLKNLEPSIRSYLGDAFCFSIIDDLAFASGWVYDKYIHLEYTPWDGQIKYADYDYYDFVPDQGVFIKSFTQIPFSFCTQEYVCELIMEMLDEEEYFFALWDENIVTNYLFDEKQHGIYEHGSFIYGYDSEQKIFLSQGYLRDEKWRRVEVPYDVLYRALCYNPEKGELSFIGYKPVQKYSWSFDYEKMKRELKNYGESLSLESHCMLDLRAEKNFFEELPLKHNIHYPSLYCMYEHKKNMVRRVTFLIDNQYISESEGRILKGQAQKIEKEFKKIMLLGIQYIMNRENILLKTICQKAEKVIAEEKEFIMELLLKIS